ncbi:MAG: arsenate reductase [Verrucomicrobia bacterium SCN 57-15]|nr:MAG: arsenate reductase [Verrucomicrobia bacterium SCN 57-15]
MKLKVLFLCVHNSARSQMAEMWLRQIAGDLFDVKSAGLEPGTLNPLAVEAMREVGIDMSRNQTRGVFDIFKSGELFHYVIAVCDAANAERCPIFPSITKRLNWSFPDPAQVRGSPAAQLEQIRLIRDAIREKIEKWVAEIRDADASEASATKSRKTK